MKKKEHIEILQLENDKKNKRKNPILCNIIGIIYILFYIVSIFSVIKLNIFPTGILIIIIIIGILISIGILKLLFNSKVKSKIKILIALISIILMLFYGFFSYYSLNTLKFMKTMKKDNTQCEEFYVVIKNEYNYNNIDDIKNKSVNVLKSEEKNYSKAKEKLSKEFNVKYIEDNSIDSIYKSVLNNKIILINNNTYDLLTESKYKIDEKCKIIYKIKIEDTIKEIDKNVNVANESFNIYISGTDSAGNISDVGKSDVNMIMTVNPNNHKILLTSIPRDYYINLHSKNSYDKLTHSSIYGINETISSVEDLLDIDINYYVRVNFTTVIDLVDIIGGITVNSEYSFTTHGMKEKYYFNEGINNLNGKQAVAFSRERKSFPSGDRQRIKNQQLVLSAIINKMTTSTALLTKYSEILNTIQNSFQTNISEKEIQNLIKSQLQNISSWNIEKNSLDGSGSSEITYTYGNQNLYVMIPDYTSVLDAKNKINSVLAK